MKRVAFILTALALSSSFSEASVRPVRVKADRVILRVEPSFKAEAICRVNQGDILSSTGGDGDWIQVLPPTNVYFWIPGRYVKDGVVSGARVYVRAQPGVGRTVVDELGRGERVVTVDSEGDWVAIVPPKDCSLWIHKTLVEFIPETDGGQSLMAKHEAKPAVEPAGRRIKRGVANEDSSSLREAVVTVPAAAYQQKGDRQQPPAFMVERGLVPLPGQGETVQYKGILGRTGMFFSRSPTGFRLVRMEGRRKMPVCFVMGNEEQLSWLVGSTLAVTGREYWLKGEKHPVVVLERILVTDRKAKTEK